MALDLPQAIKFANPQPKPADHTTASTLERVGPGGFDRRAKIEADPSVPQLHIYWNCVVFAMALDLPWTFGGANPISQPEVNVQIFRMETSDIFAIIVYIFQQIVQLNYYDTCAISIFNLFNINNCNSNSTVRCHNDAC